jgi:hypothetical protein
LELNEKIFVGCWGATLEIFTQLGEPIEKLKTASDIRCFLVTENISQEPSFEDSPRINKNEN